MAAAVHVPIVARQVRPHAVLVQGLPVAVVRGVHLPGVQGAVVPNAGPSAVVEPSRVALVQAPAVMGRPTHVVLLPVIARVICTRRTAP